MRKSIGLTLLVGLVGLGVWAGLGQAQHGGHGGHAAQGSEERAFLSGMIAHHEGALKMAEEALARAKDPKARAWAQGILRTQKGEIDLMSAWLKELGGLDQRAYQAMAQEMAAMLQELQKAPDPDRAFVELMALHHKGAVEMALEALMTAQDPRVLDLAKRIIQDQTEEIHAFRLWLLSK